MAAKENQSRVSGACFRDVPTLWRPPQRPRSPLPTALSSGPGSCAHSTIQWGGGEETAGDKTLHLYSLPLIISPHSVLATPFHNSPCSCGQTSSVPLTCAGLPRWASAQAPHQQWVLTCLFTLTTSMYLVCTGNRGMSSSFLRVL